MSPGIGVGVGLPFVHLQRRGSSILDQLFGGGQGMYAVAGLRGSVVLEDQSPNPNSTVWPSANRTTESDAVAGLTASVFSTTVAGQSAYNADSRIATLNGGAFGGGQYCLSWYMDPGSADYFEGELSLFDGRFSLDFTDTPTGETTAGDASITVEDAGGGFFRIIIAGATAGTSAFGQLRVAPVASYGASTSIAATGVKIAGVQLLGRASTPITFGSGVAFGAWTDQTGGGRHVTLPGGSANPIQLDHDGTDYFYLPGTSGNHLSVPDAAALDITGDLDLIVQMSSDDLYDAYEQLIGKWATDQNAWRLTTQTNGRLRFQFSPDGTDANIDTASSGPLTKPDGVFWLRCTVDVDRGDGDGEVSFYTSTDDALPSSWTLVSTVVVSGGVTIASTTADVEIGATNSPENIYRVIIKDGIDGTTVLDVNASDADEDSSTFTEASSNAATVTINRSASGYPLWVVKQPAYLGATDDYLTIDNSDGFFDVGAEEGMTVGILAALNDASGYMVLVTSQSNANSQGWNIVQNGNAFGEFTDASSEYKDQTSIIPDFARRLYALRLSRTTDEVELYADGFSGSPTDASGCGAVAGSSTVRIGAFVGGSYYAVFVVRAVFFTKQALTAQQISDAKDALLALNSGG